MVETSRRGFLVGAGATLIAAPAIVRVASLMAVRQHDVYSYTFTANFGTDYESRTIYLIHGDPHYGADWDQTKPTITDLYNYVKWEWQPIGDVVG